MQAEAQPDVVDEWAACRVETKADLIDTFKSYAEESKSDSDEDEGEDVEFQDLQLFLHAIGEPQLVDHFLENRVTLGQLLEFNEDDLIRCGVHLVGDRKKILENTGQMHSEKWQPSSIHELTSRSLLSSPGIYIAMNDINKHLEYIGVTFKYLRRRLEEKPTLLELGKDYVGVGKIASEIEDSLKTSKATYAQLKTLQKEVMKHLDEPAMKPANNIDQKYIARAKLRQKLVPTLVVALALVGTFKLATFFLARK